MSEEHVYGVAIMAMDEDGNKDVVVETWVADSEEEAVGLCLYTGQGADLMANGEFICGVTVTEQDNMDVENMVDRNREERAQALEAKKRAGK